MFVLNKLRVSSKLYVNVNKLMDLNQTHAQIHDYLEALSMIQKTNTF